MSRLATTPLTICECCDAVYERRPLASGEIAHCRRCGAELYRNRRLDLDAMLAIAFGGLITFVIANVYPVLIMELGGTRAQVTLWDAILATYDAGVGLVAVLAALSLFMLPLTQILMFLYVLLPLRAGSVPDGRGLPGRRARVRGQARGRVRAGARRRALGSRRADRAADAADHL